MRSKISPKSTKKHQKEIEDLRAEIQDHKSINQTLKNIQLKQEEMGKASKTKSNNLEERVAKLLAVFEDQVSTYSAKESEYIRPRKKTIKGNQFSTPEKKSAATKSRTNRYSTLDDSEEIDQNDMHHSMDMHQTMEEDVDEIETVTGSWDEDDTSQRRKHPITSLQTPEAPDTFDYSLAESPLSSPTREQTSTHTTPSDLKPRSGGFRRES
jgi:hypothetical protein